jgi:hypothetical protein
MREQRREDVRAGVILTPAAPSTLPRMVQGLSLLTTGREK